MRNFTKSLLALALMFVCVGGAKAQEEVDIPLDESAWVWGWNSTVTVTDGVMSIQLTGNYGAAGTGWDPVADWTPYSKVCVVIDSYSGGWGQAIIKFSDDTEVSQSFGGISSTTTITIDIENNAKASGVKQLSIQGGTSNPIIKVSRVYLVKKMEYEDAADIPFASNFVNYADIASFSNSAKVEFAINATIVTEEKYIGWGIGKIQSANGAVGAYDFALKNEGDNVYTCTIKDLREAIEAPAPTEGWLEGKQGLFWNIWGQGKDKGNTFNLTSIKVYEVKNLCSVTVGAAGWTTFSYNKAIGLGAINAYSAKYESGYVKLTKVTAAPANTGVIIEAAPGTYKIPTLESAAPLDDNELLVSDGSIVGNGSTIYALTKKDDKVGFMKVKDGVKIPAGKAYLNVAGGGARDFLGFDDETTGIEAVEQAAKADNQYFNLAGQRVAQPTKGLYIVNGKKVIIK